MVSSTVVAVRVNTGIGLVSHVGAVRTSVGTAAVATSSGAATVAGSGGSGSGVSAVVTVRVDARVSLVGHVGLVRALGTAHGLVASTVVLRMAR